MDAQQWTLSSWKSRPIAQVRARNRKCAKNKTQSRQLFARMLNTLTSSISPGLSLLPPLMRYTCVFI